MDLKLKVLQGKNAGHEIAVSATKFFIGRAEDCHLRPGSDLISRHHCVLLVEEGYIGVRDFGSKNGTYVNEDRVIGERELKPGDRLTVGPLHFEVVVAHGLAAKKRPPVTDIKEAVARTAHDAAQDPMDVTQWLAGAPDGDTKTPPVESPVPQSLTDTDSVKLNTTQTVADEPVDAPVEEHMPKGPHGKKPVGKLPTVAKSTKDSQEAAAAMLNKFRKRR
jgi:predicted component of type VI protein secretion system